MKCYQVNWHLAKRFPLELYADKLVVANIAASYPNPVEYALRYDYKTFVPNKSILIMFNVTDEDLTYLTLLGVPSNCLQAVRSKGLEKAVREKQNSYIQGLDK